ncbi:MAG: sugar phosphate isomerase/epimerase [Chloroflexi bacterium]|nr:sugar phosphate isomerase/epimerase [Chloroflexota bacterium]
MELGINLSFALKRWPEPERWASIVREDLGLELVQFTFDLLDPWWPQRERRIMAERVRRAAADAGITIHSAQLGLAWYTYNGLLHPDPAGRQIARQWWQRAAETAAEIGAPAAGGPLGALSAADAADPTTRDERYAAMLEEAVIASEVAAAAGLQALLIEPTPLPREIPHTIAGAQQLVADLRGRTAVPIRWVLDVGHALYRPLYGNDVSLEDWLLPLHDDIGLIHLQNHDFQSDAHWGWPDDRGVYDVASFVRTVRQASLADVPIVIELFYPFEMADDAVLASVHTTVRHCREGLADGAIAPDV